MKSLTALLAFLFLLLAASILFAETASVTGKVSPAPETGTVRVIAYPANSTSLQGEAPYRAEVGKEGEFNLPLPPGSYYFLARGGGWFNYYGRNPVTVPPEGLTKLNLLLAPDRPAPAPVADEPANLPDGGIAGIVLRDGKPVSGATVIVYTDLTSQLKGPGLGMAPPADENGRFAAPLPAGTYYLVARLRDDHSTFGPLQAGDSFGYYPGNPVVVKAGEVVRIALPLIEVPAKVEKLSGSIFGQTSIRGRIVDENKKPMAGVRAMLHADPTMLNRPDYVSQPSDEEGRFVLSFPTGGTWYLSARSTLGGAPAPGDLFGMYEGNPDHAVRLKTGDKLEGIEMVVGPMW